MKPVIILQFWLALLITSQATAQEFTIDADVRMRYEHRNGYNQPRSDTSNAANFVVQRSRINLRYKSDQLEILMSPQNIRVWGDISSAAKSDVNGLQMHQAWVQYNINTKWALKVGRQELNYDDARILGNLDWVMQGRSHDALLIKFNPNSQHSLHLGVAINAMGESNFQQNYAVKNQYKNMQFMWYKGNVERFKWSVLALNQGLVYKLDKVAYNQTAGFNLSYDHQRIKLETSAFLQTGKLQENNFLAYQVSSKVTVKTNTKWQSGVGFEYLSGKSQNDLSLKQKSFNPWYGTNHKFNGYMDYFYVGNHLNSSGLMDVFGYVNYTHKKWKLALSPHYFASGASLYRNQEKLSGYLGTELDMTASYQLLPELNINAGYSKIWISDSMNHLKGGQKKDNQWFFLAVHCNPELFANKR